MESATGQEPLGTVLFDLDGTLSDPKPGITRAVQHALQQMGVLERDLDHLECFIGPPLGLSFERHYGFSEAEARSAVGHYREYFEVRGLYENTLYPGIHDLLAELAQRGTRLALTTVKPTVYAERILRHFGIAPFFAAVVGTALDDLRASKGPLVAEALRRLAAGGRAAVVGDREEDVLAGHENGIVTVGVTYGYGRREDLLRASPAFVVGSVAELREVLWA